jgi:hypothetical protein
MNKLIVRKEDGMFVLRAIRNGELLETVKAQNAQAIIDHVRATWPVGTKTQWIILPRQVEGGALRRPVRASFLPTANRSRSWVVSPPTGARL